MRRAVTPAIPSKMYRHFAIVTVLLTGAMAMFASGENRKAAVAPAQMGATSSTPQRDNEATFATNSAAAPAPVIGSYGDDDGIAFGQPMDNPLGGLSSSVVAKLDGAEAAGYPPEYLASLTPAERELLLKGLEENGMLGEEARAARGAALAAASSRRSGAPSSE